MMRSISDSVTDTSLLYVILLQSTEGSGGEVHDSAVVFRIVQFYIG